MTSSGRPGLVAGTVATRARLPEVRALANSLAAHHPGRRLAVVVIDDEGRELIGPEPFDVIAVDELGIPDADRRAWPLIYDSAAVATAFKPWLVARLLDATGGPVLLLDAECHVFGDVTSLGELATAAGVVLVPHLLAPMVDDGCWPDERHVAEAGVHDPGILAIADTAATRDLLGRWQERARVHAMDASGGTDGRWTDLLAGFVAHARCTDPGIGVSYLNLHERPLDRHGDVPTAGGAPLRLFRFRGFDARRPSTLTQADPPAPRRALLSADPVLRSLCADRAAAVVEGDRERSSGLADAWDVLANGVPLDPISRQVFRAAAQADGPCLDHRDVSRAMSFLAEPEADGLPRLAAAVHRQRPDLADAFADPTADVADRDGLAWWWRVRASPELGIDRTITARVAAAIGRIPVPDRPAPTALATPGPVVEVVGFVQADLGIGEAARRLAQSLTAAGVTHAVTPYRRHSPSRMGADAPQATVTDIAADVEIGCVNLDHYPALARERAARPGPPPYRIGYWWWEVADFPAQFSGSFDLVDEVWCSTEFVAAALRAGSPVPVVQVPMAITEPALDPAATRAGLGLPDGFLFLFVFDFFSTMARKNPLGLVAAFDAAFPPGSGPSLVVKTINGVHRVPELEQLRLAAVDRPDITVVDGYVDERTLASMVAAADCYVSLHRSEGFGLTLADAMALGVPVIATAYGGNLEFMDAVNSTLVPARRVPIGREGAPYPVDGEWAEPDHAAAVAALRAAVTDAAAQRERAAAAGPVLLERFSVRRCGERVAARLAEIRRSRAADARMSG
jgi:glycosyltransferase involved in cell wall biosynthesis